MVHDQGETIDSIEDNVTSAAITVHDGTEQLRQAERYKVRSQLSLVLYLAQFFILSVSLVIFVFHVLSILIMISEQGKKEESVLGCYWNCHISNYHWDNCMANKEVT